ncbi:MAG: hypothetical protein ACXABY_04750 [Candidatus Thorarchaeota archaeon]|jgi:hypothetical protein
MRIQFVAIILILFMSAFFIGYGSDAVLDEITAQAGEVGPVGSI